MAVLDFIDNDWPTVPTVRLTKAQEAYVKDRLPIMTTHEIAEFLGLPTTVLVRTLQKHNIFMQGQRKYKPNVLWCAKCGAANYAKQLRGGVCLHCIKDAKEMAKLEDGDRRGRPKKEKDKQQDKP